MKRTTTIAWFLIALGIMAIAGCAFTDALLGSSGTGEPGAEGGGGIFGMLDMGLAVAASFFPPAGIGLMVLRAARKTTRNVVASIEAGKKPDGSMDWTKVRDVQVATGVGAAVKKLRNTAAVAAPVSTPG